MVLVAEFAPLPVGVGNYPDDIASCHPFCAPAPSQLLIISCLRVASHDTGKSVMPVLQCNSMGYDLTQYGSPLT